MKKVLFLLFIILNAQVNAQCWKHVKSGDFHTLGIKTDGTLWAWGNNNYGQLGDGTTANKNVPVKIGTSDDWESIFPGEHSSFAIKTDGSLWAWGFNTYGALGDGSTINKSVPIRIGNDFDWKFISNTSDHTLAQKNNNSIFSWGSNINGQLGNGSNINNLTPLQIGSETSWLSISSGPLFSIGLKIDGTIWAWGFGTYGELGNGNLVNTNTPTKVGNSNDWSSISASYHSVLAKKNNGTLWGWGLNRYGELGDGTTIQRNLPIQIGTSSNWDKIGTGAGYSYGIQTNGTLWTWGTNNAGQLGDGTFNNNYIPNQITTNFLIKEVSLGNLTTTILTVQKDIYSWGNNENGQFGNSQSSIQNTNTPLQIINCTADNPVLPVIPNTITPPTITAEGNNIYCPQTYTKIAENATISHDPSETSTDAVYIQIASGYVTGQDILKLNDVYLSTHPSITSFFNVAEGKLKIYSPSSTLIPYSDLINAIEAVEFHNSSAAPSGSRSFSISIGIGNFSYLPRNGHYYEYVDAYGITWTSAKYEAGIRKYYGLQGYLATLTSADEAQLAGAQAPGTGWIGGTDEQTEGTWRWVTGPEGLENGGNGRTFWIGRSNGTATAPDFFANWNNNEPNHNIQSFKPNGENYAHITAPVIGRPGAWNDLSNEGDPPGNYHPRGYIVEYGGMPGEPELNLSASTSLTIPQITGTTPASRCDSGSVTLKATATAGTISWYDSPTGGNLLATIDSFTTPSLSATTSYYVQVADCESTRVTVTATINTIPTISIPNTTIPICGPGTVTLTANTDFGNINWYNAASGGSIVGTGAQFTTPTITQNTTYYAEAINNGCSSANRLAVDIVVYSPPVVTDESISFCQGSSAELDAGLTGMRYLWSTGATSQQITVNTAGTYIVDVTNENNCTSRKTIIVSEHNLPEINYIDVNETTVVIYSKKEESYFEYSIDGINFQKSNVFFNAPSGLNTAYIREINLCSIATKDFIVIIVPKFFTPNNDGHNDRWEINGLSFYPKASVTIFDRYGKLISILNSRNTGWDGTYHKTMLPAADYWYVLKIDDSGTEKRGHFSLKR